MSSAPLVWQATVGGLLVLVCLVLFAAAALWEVSFLTHAVATVLFVPLGIITLSTAGATYSLARSIEPHVMSNWDSAIKYFVPAPWSALDAEDYALAAYTPVASAAVTGFILGSLLLLGAIVHAKTTVLLFSIGPELRALQTEAWRRRQEVARRRLAARAARTAAGGSAGGSSSWVGSYGSAPLKGSVPLVDVPDWSPQTTMGGLNSTRSALASSRAASTVERTPLMDSGNVARSAGSALHAVSLVPLSLEQRQHLQTLVGGWTGKALIEEHALENRIATPHPSEFASATVTEARELWASFYACFMVVAVAALASIGALSSGMVSPCSGRSPRVAPRTSTLHVQLSVRLTLNRLRPLSLSWYLQVILSQAGTCAVLSRSAASVTFAVNFSAYEDNPMKRGIIYIKHDYPLGAVEVTTDKFDQTVNNVSSSLFCVWRAVYSMRQRASKSVLLIAKHHPAVRAGSDVVGPDVQPTHDVRAVQLIGHARNLHGVRARLWAVRRHPHKLWILNDGIRFHGSPGREYRLYRPAHQDQLALLCRVLYRDAVCYGQRDGQLAGAVRRPRK